MDFERRVTSLHDENHILKWNFIHHRFEGMEEQVIFLALDNVELERLHIEVYLPFEKRFSDLSSDILWLGRESLDFEVEASSTNARGFENAIAQIFILNPSITLVNSNLDPSKTLRIGRIERGCWLIIYL